MWHMLLGTGLNGDVRLLIIILMIKCLESLASSMGQFTIGWVGVIFPFSQQLDEGIQNIGLFCCGSCPNIKSVGIVCISGY